MSDSFSKYDLRNFGLVLDDNGTLCLRWTCPRCTQSHLHQVALPSSGYLWPAAGGDWMCSNPDCRPSQRNLSFEVALEVECGSMQGRLDVPVECTICGAGYDYDRNLNYQPQCNCREDKHE